MGVGGHCPLPRHTRRAPVAIHRKARFYILKPSYILAALLLDEGVALVARGVRIMPSGSVRPGIRKVLLLLPSAMASM